MTDEGFELDREFEHPLYSPVCTFCRHLQSMAREARRCAAFPEGIPYKIWDGHNKHLKPYPGDHGIRFEAASDVHPEVLREHGLSGG